MKSIKKSLENFLKGTTPILNEEEIVEHAKKSSKKADDIIDTLFDAINNDLDNYNGVKSLERVRELLKCVSTVMLNVNYVNRDIIARKTHGLNYKLSNLIESNKKKINVVDIDNAGIEIEKTRIAVETISDQTINTETKQYDLISKIVDSIKDIAYIEKAFNQVPSLVNAKDRLGSCLFQNMVIKYVDSIMHNNKEDILYYNNLLTLIISRSNFTLSEKDKRKCLEVINTEINKMSYNKKTKKNNSEYVDFLSNLTDTVKGEEKEIKIDELSRKYNISINFSPSIISQVDSIKTKTGTMTDRMVVDDYTITIDDEDAIEIDDALTCRKLANGNYLLGVHIASVLGYFSWNSEIVQEAIDRGRSIYLPKKYQNREDDYNRVIPIFPYDFSAVIGSLLPGKNKLARSYFFEIDREGNIVHEEFKKTIVKSDLKTTYKQINDVLTEGTDNEELQRIVNCLFEVTNILDRNYKVSDLYEKFKDSRDDFSELPVKNVGSQKIINKAMMLTGDRVANFCSKHNYPCLYRIHSVEVDSNIQAMLSDLNRTYGDQYEQLCNSLFGIYPRGEYGIEGSHYGMGLDHYCHCTSELRRAPDIVMEHVLEVCYDKEPTDEEIIKLQSEIGVIASRIKVKQDAIDWFIRDYKAAYQKRRH